ncbi:MULTISPECIES: hypothetical protein [Cytobacillus]|uniref:Uncharacterized protein n=1 Tax=Cytobacillus stercorigallinarum TaxID=2762240 RepID=A0ABR8QSS0_9BACI|nr:hypothetical protein [Cytobacillus stercorigallinarum]MBD7938581.1 hypothetical protein [Cytobacillus stercorigallinarum]
MGQKYSNVGVLNLIQATEESIQDIEKINNVGLLVYSQKNAYLVPKLNIKNIGQTIMVEKNVKMANGVFKVDSAYLKIVDDHEMVFINGVIIVNVDVTLEELQQKNITFIVNGVIYSPPHLKGAIQSKLLTTNGTLVSYKGAEPKLENGNLHLTTGYLAGLDEGTTLLVNGKVTIDEHVDLTLLKEKIERLDINGTIHYYDFQQSLISGKLSINGKQFIIPKGYQVLSTQTHLNKHNIKRYKQHLIYTSKPIFIDSTVTREGLNEAFSAIHSLSYILCPEGTEDILFEKLTNLENEVFVYAKNYIAVKEETWFSSNFKQLDPQTTVIIQGQLTINDMLTNEDIDHISEIILAGDILVVDESTKGVLKKKINQSFKGEINVVQKHDEQPVTNIGELVL